MLESLDLRPGSGLVSWTETFYEVIEFLGEGGTARTYLALARSGGNKGLSFAIKVFHRLEPPERYLSFMKEIHFLRQCNHPTIMKVFDEGLHQDAHPFVVAEYLPDTLAKLIAARRNRRPRPDDFATNLAYAMHALSALSYLARLEPQVVHRDIKPQNLFVKGGSCILGDFGLMRRRETGEPLYPHLTEPSTGPRMPQRYRTPDLIRHLTDGTRPTPQSDVYQLGLVLAELFTGMNPQQPMSRGGFTSPIVLEPLGEVSHPHWEPTAALISRMLAGDPRVRPTAAEALDAFQELYRMVAKTLKTVPNTKRPRGTRKDEPR